MSPSPRHPNQRLNAKWTKVIALASPLAKIDLKHFEVEAYHVQRQEVILRASLDKSIKLTVSLRDLRDPAQWRSGWLAIAATSDDLE